MKDVLLNKKVGFIGCGNMAEAIISAITKNVVSSKNIFVSDVNIQRLNYVSSKYKLTKLPDNCHVVELSDIIFLAVKPYQIEDVLKETACCFNKSKIVISIAAGIKTSRIEKHLKKVPIIRVMPNTPALVGEGAIAITKGRYANFRHLDIAKKLLDLCGIVVTVDESQMDTITAVSGSGPAYIFYIAEIMQKTAKKLGLSEKIAKKLVNQTLLGASQMLVSSTDGPETLRQKVTSKGGTTEAAFKVLTNQGFAKIFEQAIFEAMKRSREISND